MSSTLVATVRSSSFTANALALYLYPRNCRLVEIDESWLLSEGKSGRGACSRSVLERMLLRSVRNDNVLYNSKVLRRLGPKRERLARGVR